MAARAIRVNLVGDADSLNRAVDSTERRLSGLHQRLGALGRGMDRTNRPSVRFAASLGRIGTVGITALGGVGVAVAALGGAALAMGAKTLAGLEQAQIGFTELLGSAERAEDMISDLKKFAAGTPFELPGLVAASQGLLGAGTAAEDVIPTLRDLGDAAGALGLDQERFGRIMTAVTQIMVKGKVSSEELLQITEAGLPVWQLLSDALGLPVTKIQELISKGELTADEVLPKLFDQMHKDYGGAMAAQSQSLSGLWSTLMDTLSIGLADVLVPLQDKLKVGLKGAIEGVGTALGGIANFVENTLVPNLTTLRDWWVINKDKVELLVTTFTTLFSPAAEDATGDVDDLRLAGERLSNFLDGALVVLLETKLGFNKLGEVALTVAKWIDNLAIAAGFLANAIDLLSGGTGHAADSFIEHMRRMREDTERELRKVREDTKRTQRAIDGLHGKTIDIIANIRVNKTNPGFGVFAFQEGTMFVPQTGLALVHRGEIVIPPRAAERVREGGALFGTAAGAGTSVTVNAVTTADAHQIAVEVAWALRTGGAAA